MFWNGRERQLRREERKGDSTRYNSGQPSVKFLSTHIISVIMTCLPYIKSHS